MNLISIYQQGLTLQRDFFLLLTGFVVCPDGHVNSFPHRKLWAQIKHCCSGGQMEFPGGEDFVSSHGGPRPPDIVV